MQAFHVSISGIATGAKALLILSLFIIPFGAGFGAAAVGQGMAPAQAIAASAFIFAGAAQYAVLDLWSAPLPFVSIALVALAVNARHIILGATLAPAINTLPFGERILSLMLLSDANFAKTRQAIGRGERDLGHLIGGGIVMWSAWVCGTAIGARLGSSAETPANYGVDVVMLAFFTAVLTGDINQVGHLWPVAIASLTAIATAPVFPEGWNIIAAALLGGAAGAFRDA